MCGGRTGVDFVEFLVVHGEVFFHAGDVGIVDILQSQCLSPLWGSFTYCTIKAIQLVFRIW